MGTKFAGTTVAELGGTRTTVTSRFDSVYVNEAAQCQNDTPFPMWRWEACTGVVWLSATMKIPANSGGQINADGEWYRIYDENTELLVLCSISNGLTTWTLYGTGTDVTANLNMGSDRIVRHDLRFEDDGTNFTLEVYVDGSLYDTLTTPADAAGLPQGWQFTNLDVTISVTDVTALSEVMVRDNGDSTLGRRLFQHVADANGFHTAWDGAFADVNFGGGDLLGAAGEKESWTLDNYTAPAPVGVEEVLQSVTYVKPASGPNTLAGFVRIGGVDYATPDHTLVDRGHAILPLAQNPATAAAWDTAAVNALEMGLEAKVV